MLPVFIDLAPYIYADDQFITQILLQYSCRIFEVVLYKSHKLGSPNMP